MKWYETIGIIVLLLIVVYVIIAPWLSIMDIHKSIDRLTEEIRKWREQEDE
jgi:hypothetical protein